MISHLSGEFFFSIFYGFLLTFILDFSLNAIFSPRDSPRPLIISPKIRNLKFRNKLLLSFLIVFVPLILMSKALIFVQSQKLIEAIIEKELNQSATLLKDLIQTTADISIENRLKAITVFKFRNNGYAFIVNEKGNAVMHPFLQGKNLLAQPEAFSAIIQKILNEKSGKIKTFGLSVPDTRSGEQLVIFRYLPQYKWIIGAANYVDEIYTPLSTFSTLITLDILFFLLIFVVLAYLLSRSVTKPLENFTHILNNSKGDDYSIRLNYNAQDEIGSLARHFNTLMTRIKKYHDQLNDQRQKTIAAQNALKTNELRLQVLFNQSFQLISILSPYGIIEDVNENQLAFSQCTKTDVLYKPYWDSPWFRQDEKCRQEIKLAVGSAALGETVRIEATIVDGNEQIKEVDISLKPVCSGKHVEFIVAESRDITETKRAEKERRKILIQLEKAQKMEAIGTLAGGIAHDFNNILSSIFGYAQLAQMNLNNPEKLNNHMNQILKGAQRASDLVKQILTFSRQTKNQKSPLKLHLVVKEALKLLRSSIPTTIGMVTRVETRDMVNADPTQMHQMIMNLCTNAYHAMTTSGGTLTVSLDTVDQIAQAHQNKDYFQPGPFLKLMVKDTGNGMNQEAIEKAFDPYFTTKEMDRLALVRAIVEDHKGFSCIENITGHGTSVFVYLPVVTKNDSSADSHTGIDASLKTGKETIMVVDDEPDILALIKKLLNRFGYSVHLFNNGKSALNAYQEGKISFDMVITDMTMPHMTGIALAEAILSENKNMPIILCSGYSKTTTWSDVKAIGVQAFLEKPLDTHLLLSTMRTLFDK